MKASLTGDRGVTRHPASTSPSAPPRTARRPSPRRLVSRIDGQAPLLRRSHRDAGFMVLLAPDVPAVLLEMGFVTNPEDEAMPARPRPARPR